MKYVRQKIKGFSYITTLINKLDRYYLHKSREIRLTYIVYIPLELNKRDRK